MKPDRGADVLVVGGGLQGLSSALQLARRGLVVRVLEADDFGRHASGVNAGGVRTLDRHDAEIPLALHALGLWHRMPEWLGEDASFEPVGQLKLAETEAELGQLRARVARLQAMGYRHERMIGADDVRTMIPAIAPHVTGAIHAAGDGQAFPYHVVTALRRACERAGVRLHAGTPVRQLRHDGRRWRVDTPAGRHEAGWLVNAAGAWGGEIARQAGEPVPLEAGGLMLMVTARVGRFLGPVLGATGRPLSFKQYRNGTVVIGGGLRCRADPVARVGEVDTPALARSARTVADLFPHLRDVPIVRAWAGVEGFLPDGIPVIGPSRTRPGLVHAFGFSAHGFALSPAVGEVVADLVTSGRSTLPIAAFAIDRFPLPAPVGAPAASTLET